MMETTQMPTSAGTDKQNVAYAFSEVLPTREMEGNSDTYSTWINLEDNMLNEIKQTQRDKYCMVSLI